MKSSKRLVRALAALFLVVSTFDPRARTFAQTFAQAPRSPRYAQSTAEGTVTYNPILEQTRRAIGGAFRSTSFSSPLRRPSTRQHRNYRLTNHNVSHGFVPRHERFAGRLQTSQDAPDQTILTEPLPEGQLAPETDSVPTVDELSEFQVETTIPEDACGCGTCAESGWCGDVDCCGHDACCGQADCGGPCATCCPWPCPIPLDNLSVFGGVHGFKNPSNLNADGSFGFQAGLNWGAPLWLLPYSGLGIQVGFQGVFSDFSGAGFTTESRDQTFFTAGIFRRADWGWQGGVVYDRLRDEWYHDVELSQIRGEISWMHPCGHEWGFWFTASDDTDASVSPIDQQLDTWEPTNLYAFFYRRQFQQVPGGVGRFYAGFTDESDGILGADGSLPLNDCWDLQASFIYVIPEQSNQAGGSENEGWNLGINLVWHPRRFGCGDAGPSYYRPLFNVADNGTFLVDRIRN